MSLYALVIVFIQNTILAAESRFLRLNYAKGVSDSTAECAHNAGNSHIYTKIAWMTPFLQQRFLDLPPIIICVVDGGHSLWL